MVNVFIWAGISLTTFCLLILARDDWEMFSRGRRRARGAIVNHRRSIEDGSQVFVAMIRFESEGGRQIEFADIVFSSTPTPPLGTMIEVVYPSRLPEKAKIIRPKLRLMLYVFMALLIARLLNLVL